MMLKTKLKQIAHFFLEKIYLVMFKRNKKFED
jgi:hypothetical protein